MIWALKTSPDFRFRYHTIRSNNILVLFHITKAAARGIAVTSNVSKNYKNVFKKEYLGIREISIFV